MLGLLPVSASTQTEILAAEVPRYWQVSCTEHQGALDAGVDVVLRRTGMTESAIELPSRIVTFWRRGFQDHGEDGRWNLSWPDIKSVSVRKIGLANPAWVLTVTSRNQNYGSREMGAVELVCLRLIERMFKCYGPSPIEGSPPLPHWPLHDPTTGEIVPEPKYADPFCPDK